MSDESAQLQALLYADGGEMNRKSLSEALDVSNEELSLIAGQLSKTLKDSGLSLVQTGKTMSLRTQAKHAKLIAKVHKKNLEKDLGDAGLEVLAIVLYKEGATKIAIDHVRGVNSAMTLRNLTIRGLLERSRWKKDARQTLYTPSAELLAHLGVTSTTDLPEYESVKEKLESFGETASENYYGDN